MERPYPTQPTPAPNQTVPSIGWSAGPPASNTPYVSQPGVIPSSQEGDTVAVKPPEGLVQAVQTQNVHVIKAMIKEKPDSVHMKGFVGLTPLHKAVLRGETEIVRLLLDHGADPNARNEFDETPVHYACKRGIISHVQLLVDAGGDVRAEDRAGKGCIHHAAHGGSVLCMQYLNEVCGLSTHVRDQNLNTPLHLICSLGNEDVLKYLLRKQRSDIFAQDFAGNNAMHIAASTAQLSCCWKLLEAGGLGLLHVENQNGLLPMNMADEKKSEKFLDVFLFLKFYTKRYARKEGSPYGPMMGWYLLLLFAPVVYPCILFLGHLNEISCGSIISFCLVLSGFFMSQQTHRLNHACRWPNPMQFGFFAAGLMHTTIFHLYNVTPYLLHEGYTFFCALTLPLVVALFYLYARLLTVNPGLCKESNLVENGTRYLNIGDIANGAIRPETFCIHCEILPPSTSRHCKICCSCFYRLDHHCLFLYRCIASNNHRLFVCFIALCLTNMLLFLWTTSFYLLSLYSSEDLSLILLFKVFNQQPWCWTLLVANTASAAWGFFLLKFQLQVISQGHTTVYRPNAGRINLTHEQRLQNLKNFFKGLEPSHIDLPRHTFHRHYNL